MPAIFIKQKYKTSPYIFKFAKSPMLEIDKEYNIKQKFFDKIELTDEKKRSFERYLKLDIEKGSICAFNKYRIGDKVLVFREKLSNKLANNWTEGYVVCKKVNDDSYIVENNSSRMRVNKNHLKLDTSL
ncbi:hypothetical protein H311_01603 [Anncaliia algerae PRA109]|nr:hypothetical protein H311_01603 [Anncaliia algerae PRA109]